MSVLEQQRSCATFCHPKCRMLLHRVTQSNKDQSNVYRPLNMMHRDSHVRAWGLRGDEVQKLIRLTLAGLEGGRPLSLLTFRAQSIAL